MPCRRDKVYTFDSEEAAIEKARMVSAIMGVVYKWYYCNPRQRAQIGGCGKYHLYNATNRRVKANLRIAGNPTERKKWRKLQRKIAARRQRNAD